MMGGVTTDTAEMTVGAVAHDGTRLTPGMCAVQRGYRTSPGRRATECEKQPSMVRAMNRSVTTRTSSVGKTAAPWERLRIAGMTCQSYH
jgi:hypothetical protein